MGVLITVAFIVVGLLGQYIAPYAQHASRLPDAGPVLAGPSPDHPFGTDRLGRDIMSRVIVGARISLLLICITLATAVSIGTVVGLIAGFAGGWLDELLMRLTDGVLALPGLVLAMLVATTLGGGLVNTIVAVAFTWWPHYARLIRGEVLRIRETPYVEAAAALGSSKQRLLARHILPNATLPLVVQITVDSGRVLLVAAALGFLGLGARAPQPEWGLMVSVGREYLPFFWWESFFPGLAIFVVVIGLNLFGDGLRSVLDPRDSGRY